MTEILATDRLVLRCFTLEDAPFILELVNDIAFLRHIGDKGVRTVDDACAYLRDGPLESYRKHGFGLWAVVLRETGEAVGMCGLLKREALPNVDIGFAFLERHRRHGYAFESASAVLDHARDSLGLSRVVAVTAPDNDASAALLERLSMRIEGTVTLTGDTPPVRLHAMDFDD